MTGYDKRQGRRSRQPCPLSFLFLLLSADSFYPASFLPDTDISVFCFNSDCGSILPSAQSDKIRALLFLIRLYRSLRDPYEG